MYAPPTYRSHAPSRDQIELLAADSKDAAPIEFYVAGGHVHPLSLTRGYAKAAILRGAQMFCKTPVTALDRVDGKWRATTPQGEITAENVVLATNGYTNDLWPGLRQTFYPLISVSLATRPLDVDEQKTVLPGSVTISDSRLAIYYARYDRDKRLIFGCVGSMHSADALSLRRLKGGLTTVFPQIGDIEIERKWAGRIAVTPEMMPHLHEPAPGVLAGLGYSGRGIAMTSVMGRTLAGKLLGQPDDDLPFPVMPITPLPMHGLTSRLIPLAAPAMTLKDKLDTLTFDHSHGTFRVADGLIHTASNLKGKARLEDQRLLKKSHNKKRDFNTAKFGCAIFRRSTQTAFK